jgi:hypothetical protein
MRQGYGGSPGETSNDLQVIGLVRRPVFRPPRRAASHGFRESRPIHNDFCGSSNAEAHFMAQDCDDLDVDMVTNCDFFTYCFLASTDIWVLPTLAMCGTFAGRPPRR